MFRNLFSAVFFFFFPPSSLFHQFSLFCSWLFSLLPHVIENHLKKFSRYSRTVLKKKIRRTDPNVVFLLLALKHSATPRHDKKDIYIPYASPMTTGETATIDGFHECTNNGGYFRRRGNYLVVTVYVFNPLK